MVLSRIFRRKASPWRGVDFLDVVPRRLAGWEDGLEADQVVVLLPRYRDPILGRWLQPRLPDHKKHIRVPLEERGSWLWRRADGMTPVREMCGGFRARFPEDAEDVEKRISVYLYHLSEHGFIGFGECMT